MTTVHPLELGMSWYVMVRHLDLNFVPALRRHPPEHLVHGPDVDYTIDSRILGLMLGEALEMADWPQMAGQDRPSH